MATERMDHRQFEWRTGRKLVRTIYAVTHEDWEQHPLIGVMDTPELAIEAVQAHNRARELSAQHTG